MPRPDLKPWLLALALTTGCTITPVHRYDLSVELTNDANRALAVEGRTNLPEGAPIEAILSTPRDGLTVSTSRGKVKRGRYFLVLDVQRAPGGEALDLEVMFDPMLASLELREKVGPGGVGMGGPLTEERDGRTVLVRRLGVLFPMESREAAMRSIDPGNPQQGIQRMESYVLRNPTDTQAAVVLALVLLETSEPERHAGSRAHALLERAFDLNPTGTFPPEAREWLTRLQTEERELAAQRQLQERLANSNPRRIVQMNSSVIPGQQLGGVLVGRPAARLFAQFWPDHFPSYQGTQVETLSIKDLYDVQIGVDPVSKNIVSASTHSEFFRLEGGTLGVGSLLQEVQALYPSARPRYGQARVLEDGTEESVGVADVGGLRLEVTRRVDPEFRMPVATVSGLEVYSP